MTCTQILTKVSSPIRFRFLRLFGTQSCGAILVKIVCIYKSSISALQKDPRPNQCWCMNVLANANASLVPACCLTDMIVLPLLAALLLRACCALAACLLHVWSCVYNALFESPSKIRLYQRVTFICPWVISQQLLTPKYGRAEMLPSHCLNQSE